MFKVVFFFGYNFEYVLKQGKKRFVTFVMRGRLMINREKLKEGLERYKAVFSLRWKEEKYKWEAVKHFQDYWNIEAADFAEMFSLATEEAASLLDSMNNFPRGMLIEYAKQNADAVKKMFVHLYDETKDMTERVLQFQEEAQILCEQYSASLQHYQRLTAISVYLWLRYPDKYSIFKYSVCRAAALELESDFMPKRGNTAENIKGNLLLLDEITEEVAQDTELIRLFEKVRDQTVYQDTCFRTLAYDLVSYIADGFASRRKTEKVKKEAASYIPKFTKEQWLGILKNKLTKGEYELVADVLRETPLVQESPEYEWYEKESFLYEVYMTPEKYDTLKALLLKKQNVILQGAPGVGKTFAAKRLAYSMIGLKNENQIEMVQFHQNYSYEDFIMGYKPNGNVFELKYGIFYRFCQKAAKDPEQPYFFLIDEINRGNMSKIFGELLMLIEKEYRGMEIVLAYDGQPFFVPKNLYLIGMMNTADRSLAMIDYALRRRFSFFTIEPGFSSEGFQKYLKELENETFCLLIEQVRALNLEISKDSTLGAGFCIGHSYFCGQEECTEEWMQSVVEYDIIPMLAEYWFDEPAKLQKWQSRLRGVFND